MEVLDDPAFLPGKPEDYVEEPAGSGQWWLLIDAEKAEVFGPLVIRSDWTPADVFAKRERANIRKVLKSVIVARLIASNKIALAKGALDANPAAFARWFAPDRPAVNYNDPEALALLRAIGADIDYVMGEGEGV